MKVSFACHSSFNFTATLKVAFCFQYHFDGQFFPFSADFSVHRHLKGSVLPSYCPLHCMVSLPVALYFFAACCRRERGAHAGDDLPVPQPAADAEEDSPGAGGPDHHHRGGDGHQVSLCSA